MGLILAMVLCAQLSPQALDLEFSAAVESFAAQATRGAIPEPYGSLIDRLDSDIYKIREKAAKALLETARPSRMSGMLMRARSGEHRPEVRYWLNRILRDLNRCQRCEGRGYCAQFDPAQVADQWGGCACRRCGRNEWQHGEQWIDGDRGHYPCNDCNGLGTHWAHYAVD